MVMGDKVDKHEREERNCFEDERNVPVLPLGDFRQYRGPVALRICTVYAWFWPITLHVVPGWVLFHPWSQQ